jgi:ABC-type transporter Mla maintaining outer membrane lipid asymmetry ATPase subunit MlaF
MEKFITFNNVSYVFENKTILEQITLELAKGKVYVVVGPNGCGKTMFLKLMAGIFEPTTGTVEAAAGGRTMSVSRAIYDHHIHAGFVFEHSGLINNMTVFDNIALPYRYYETMNEGAVKDRVDGILQKMEMVQYAKDRPAQLSLGNRKLVNIAMALANNPQLVLYDNPTLGLDIGASKAIKNLIKRFQTEYNLTSVIATNNIYFACDVADRMIMVDNGRVCLIAAPGDFMRADVPQVKNYLAGLNISSAI